MTEEEILSLSSAIVDAYLHKASIYALTYVEPQFQTPAIATYPANSEVLKLLESDPNIVRRAEQELSRQVRSSLESSLAASMTAPSKGLNRMWHNPQLHITVVHHQIIRQRRME